MKILLVNPNNIGDVVLSTPLLDALHVLFPGCEITYIAKNRCKDILLGDARITRLYGYDFHWTSRKEQNQNGFWDALVAWRKQHFDVAIVTVADFRANMLVRLWAKATPFWGLVDRANGYTAKDWLRSLDLLLTNPVYNDDAGLHQVERLWLIVKSIDSQGILPAKPLFPKLTPAPLDEKLCPKEPFMVIHPGANVPEKVWPIEKMAQVARELKSFFAEIIVVGSKDEVELGDRLTELTGCVHSRCGKMSLNVLKSLIARASLYLGNDTGPTHMAAALGVPVVSIVHSKRQAIRWGPYRPGDKTVGAVWRKGDVEPIHCHNSEKVWHRATVDEVLHACFSVLSAERSNELMVE